jgi:hypothetical protein
MPAWLTENYSKILYTNHALDFLLHRITSGASWFLNERLSCKHFNNLAIPYLFRTLRFELTVSGCDTLEKLLAAQQHV